MSSTQARNSVDPLHTWTNLWSGFTRGFIPYGEVRAWCAGLTEAEGEGLWRELQEQRMRENRDWATA
jgi:hypothetical protein